MRKQSRLPILSLLLLISSCCPEDHFAEPLRVVLRNYGGANTLKFNALRNKDTTGVFIGEPYYRLSYQVDGSDTLVVLDLEMTINERKKRSDFS